MFKYLMIYASLLVSFMPVLGIVADEGGGGAGPDKKNEPTKVKSFADAEQQFRQLVSQFKSAYATSGEKTEAELKAIQEKFDKKFDDYELAMDQKMKSIQPASGERKQFEHIDTFKKALVMFARGDRNVLSSQVEDKSLEIKSGYHHPEIMRQAKSDNIVRFDLASAGALLMPAEISQSILYNAIEATPVAGLVNTTSTSAPEKTTPLRVGTPGIQWIGEEGTVSKGKITYKNITLTPHKAAARYGMSIEFEQDTAHDPVTEINKAFADDFSVGIGSAVLNGDGNKKPTGMIGNLTGYNSGGLALTTDMLIRMQEQILEVYQSTGQWLFNRKTRAYIRTLILSSTNGLQYTWEPDFQRKSPTLLLGAPVNIARDGDMAGIVTGNFTAGNVPILFGDFKRAYELTTRSDMYIIDDPYSESSSFIRNLNIMSRVDGKPMQTEAAVELRITS